MWYLVISYLETTTNETLGGVQGVVGVSDRLTLRHEADQSSAIRLRSGADEKRGAGQGRAEQGGQRVGDIGHLTKRDANQQSCKQTKYVQEAEKQQQYSIRYLGVHGISYRQCKHAARIKDVRTHVKQRKT